MNSKLRLSKIICASACLISWAGFCDVPSHAFSNNMNKEVIVTIADPLSDVVSAAQPISGKVTDDKGAPLPGATVIVKGSTRGTTTDTDGKFVIDADSDAMLEISFVGYSSKEVSVNGQSSIVVQLNPNLSQLNEVVVVGYGTQKRSDVTGAISSINSESFNRGVVTNPGELLQGKLAGVSIAANSGEPGAAQDIIIRGIGSLRSGTQPLYVVDGFLLDNSSTGVPTNPLNFINPNDIESIDVLKDASATAVYGSRAANGVVVITTKKGKGKPQINFAASTAVSSIANTIDVFDADAFRSQVVATGGTLQDFNANTNWQDELTQRGVSNNLNLSMSGASSGNFSYFTSVGYQDQEGILKNSRLKRYSGKLNMNQRAFNGRLNIDYNLTASHTENLRPSITSTISDMLSLNPTVAPYTDGKPTLLNTNALNPLARYDLFSDKAINNRILANFSPSIEIFDGLTYKLNFGVDYSATNRNEQYKPYPAVINESDISNGVLDAAINSNTNQLVENTLTYNWNKDVHNVTVLAGHSFQKFLDETRTTTYRGFANNNIEPIYQDHTSTTAFPTAVSSDALKNELQSFFGRVNYVYGNKYMFTGTFRADGSSKFGENNKYGYFPSFALGWNISNENFMDNSFFNNLKLRASWGRTGNQEIPSKITKASYLEQRLQTGAGSVSTYPIDTDATSLQGYPYGIIYTRLANPNLQWEVSTQIDLGIDFAFFGSRMTGTLDYFNKESSNILLEVVPSDPVQPTSTYWNNIPGMVIQNNGIELTLNYGSDQKRDFSYNIGGNLTYIQNNVQNSPYAVLATGAAQGSGQSGATINGYINNESLGAFYMYQFDGINADNGQNAFRDTNGDGQILDNDRLVVGSAIPKLIYGYNLNLKYKTFDLGLNFNGVAGNKIFNHTTMTLFNRSQLAKSNNTTDFAIQYPNEALTNANIVSTRYLENGSFLRLNNATLAYNLNLTGSRLADVFQRASLTLTGQNLFVITDYSGFDPEVNTGSASGGIQTFGIDRFTYPRARTFVLGLNVTF
ncbi:SusC/RagA family TonB-linked outer membrane protein [Dyadobacter arcticus]|uniref:Iron complex outermembrane receptor protein n=1 Tax=Dyadobacter arcticus TaxID=1078754 RepID=A0ABX0UUV7_9BACT|nr:TonB-dependent receptor [Dyadobacter arcticus]NIJ54711.1 iron complex outermembrane receptor protein [Dyadobacter arcticus]